MQPPSFPDARGPARSRTVESLGIRLQVHEWGDPEATPILLSHGMFDHGRGFDRLAPLLADRLRVVAFDQRGHGDSEWAESYLWEADVADVVNVYRSLCRPGFLLGHSKGGGQVVEAALHLGDEVLGVVNLDGFGPPPEGFDHPRHRDAAARSLPERLAQFLDFRRNAAATRTWRPYESLESLAERRRQQNPRLSPEWLRYFVYHGARRHPDGWRWKVDPLAGGGFGPWKPDWIAGQYAQLRVPMLAVVGSVEDTWGPLPEAILGQRLAGVRDLERAVVEGAGHFIHMEEPRVTAQLVLDFVRRRTPEHVWR